MIDDKLLKALEEARKIIRKEPRHPPPNIYHTKYGWLRIDGILTEAGEKFFEEYHKKAKASDEASHPQS